MQTPTRISTGETGQVGGEGFPPGANRGGRGKEGRKEITEYATTVSTYLKNNPLLLPPEGAARQPWADGGETEIASAKLEDGLAKLKT